MSSYALLDELKLAPTVNPSYSIGSLIHIHGSFIHSLPGAIGCGAGIAMVLEEKPSVIAVIFAYGDMKPLDLLDMTFIKLGPSQSMAIQTRSLLDDLGDPYICPRFIWENDYKRGGAAAIDWERVIGPPRRLAEDLSRKMVNAPSVQATAPIYPVTEVIPEDLQAHSDTPKAAPCREDRLIPETYQQKADGHKAMDIIKGMFG